MLRKSLLLGAMLLGACGAAHLDGGPGDRSESLTRDTAQPVPPVDCAVEQAAVEALTREARALAVAGGCEDVAQCASTPYGDKACGGPQGHLVFCTATTDRAALEAKLAALQAREERFNAACQVASDCTLEQPPSLALGAGQCRAQ